MGNLQVITWNYILEYWHKSEYHQWSVRYNDDIDICNRFGLSSISRNTNVTDLQESPAADWRMMKEWSSPGGRHVYSQISTFSPFCIDQYFVTIDCSLFWNVFSCVRKSWPSKFNRQCMNLGQFLFWQEKMKFVRNIQNPTVIRGPF